MVNASIDLCHISVTAHKLPVFCLTVSGLLAATSGVKRNDGNTRMQPEFERTCLQFIGTVTQFILHSDKKLWHAFTKLVEKLISTH